jgi:hypothetical protein
MDCVLLDRIEDLSSELDHPSSVAQTDDQFLPVFLGLGVVTAYVGKVALGDMRVQRLKAGGKP